MFALLKSLDGWLLPKDREDKYLPYVWLAYLAMFFIPLFTPEQHTHLKWITYSSSLVFLFIYFNGYHVKGWRILNHIIALTLLAIAVAPYNPFSSVFTVFAAAFCMLVPSIPNQIRVLTAVISVTAVSSFVFSLSIYFYLPALTFGTFIGVINIYQREIARKRQALKLSQKEVKKVATIAERERIARDLHDAVGHHLAVIALKAELAEKQLDKQPQKTKDTLKELQQLARDTLRDVRSVVSGYHAASLDEEVTNTKAVLQAQGIDVHCTYQPFELNQDVSRDLALILRELVTNIIKHAYAHQVSIHVHCEQRVLSIQVKDDGRGFQDKEHHGNGLKGITQRVERLGGELQLSSQQGTDIQIRIPL